MAARSVKSEHQLRTRPLAERLLPGQGLQLAHELDVSAERQLGVDPRLQAGQAKLL